MFSSKCVRCGPSLSHCRGLSAEETVPLTEEIPEEEMGLRFLILNGTEIHCQDYRK